MKTISIKNKDYILKYTIRAFFIFENITGRTFTFGKSIDEYLLFYSVLLANNEFDIPFDEFINMCDTNPSYFAQFSDFLTKEIELRMQETDNIKKKKPQKKKP